MTMRDLILDEIEAIRVSPNGFTSGGDMRWHRWWIVPSIGHIFLSSKKERNREEPTAVRLHETTRADFETLNDKSLLACYTLLVRYVSKQM